MHVETVMVGRWKGRLVADPSAAFPYICIKKKESANMMPFVLRYQLNILCRVVRGFATCRTTPAQPQMIEAADEFVDEFQLNRIFYHWSRSVPSKNGSRIPQCNFWSGYTIFASCGHKGCQLPFGYLLDMRDTSMQHLMRKPPSSRLFIYCFFIDKWLVLPMPVNKSAYP